MYRDKKTDRVSSEVCAECGSAGVSEQIKEQSFAYGPEGDQVVLKASMPVLTCSVCGYEYFDERGEAARHVAVCRHLGVHTPEEIRNLRETLQCTRAEFCQIAGFGSASLQRWESGLLVPSVSNDQLIYLLGYPDNVERIRRRTKTSDGAISWIVSAAEPSPALASDVCEIRTRNSVRRFRRFANRPRVLHQANEWNLRRAQCT
jgi:putative zinc finger/helix-turn-helix YgiT family protein